MNKQLHTQGRLVVTNSRLFSEGFGIDCICNMQVGNQPCWEEDAHRLAACWNACIGIPTDDLEDTKLLPMLDAYGMAIHQRDELLAALKDAVETIEWMYGCSSPASDEIEKSISEGNAVIAKAEGGAV